jgi:hypothetical protein
MCEEVKRLLSTLVAVLVLTLLVATSMMGLLWAMVSPARTVLRPKGSIRHFLSTLLSGEFSFATASPFLQTGGWVTSSPSVHRAIFLYRDSLRSCTGRSGDRATIKAHGESFRAVLLLATSSPTFTGRTNERYRCWGN